MDCEQALALISAQIDREIEPDDRTWLDVHLQECPACRATADAFALQDSDLRRTFAPRREAVAALAERVSGRLSSSEGRSASANHLAARRIPRRLAWAIGAAAAAAAILVPVFLANWKGQPERVRQPGLEQLDLPLSGLTPRPLPTAPPITKVAVGDTVQTKAGERSRVILADGSVLYVNQNTTVRLEAERRLQLSEGNVFVEVAPRQPEADGSTFLVQTPDRAVKAFGTKFEVQASKPGTEVLVTQGRVEVSDARQAAGKPPSIHVGQRVLPGSLEPTQAPRASHQLDWTRDLMAAAESPLVPASQYDGGALIAVDANGQEAKLSLRDYHVDVHVEDGFARTTIDQTYFNHHPWRLEGTFYFPLPPDASLNRLAMYVDGVLMEGGMAEREYARQVYEQIVRSQRDPALLEWVDGSTFKMRVFPLEGRQEKRIVLSYVQRLPGLYGRTSYRFPAGHNLQMVNHWSFHAAIKNGARLAATSPTHARMRMERAGDDLIMDVAENDARLDRDVALELVDPTDAAQPRELARFSRADHEGAAYLMLRYRPDLPGVRERQRRDWVFLFESSADRDPLLARTQIEIIRTLLNNVEHDDTFAILSAGTLVRPFADEPKPATPANVAAAIAFLEKTHLIGALDLGRALQAAEPLVKAGKNPWLVHVGSGLTGMGRRQEELTKLIPAGVRYVGVGVGKRWGRDFMKQTGERSGGYFTQINPDEPVAWRAFDLLATLETPRLLDVKVTAGDDPYAERDGPRFLTFNGSVAQGEEVCAVARLDGRPLPQFVTITGMVDGQPFRRTLPVQNVTGEASYLPRSWAKLEIDRLLAANPIDNQPKIIALSKAMYVMTPFTSLLVLENEAMYQQFKVDRGRKDHWALYPCPDKIPVVYEPDPTQPVDVRNAPKTAKPQANQVLQTILVRVPARFLYSPRHGNRGEYVVQALQVYTGAYAVPDADGALTHLGRLGDLPERTALGVEGEEDRKLRLSEFERLAREMPLGERDYRLSKAKKRVVGVTQLRRSGLVREQDETFGEIFIVGNERTRSNVILSQAPSSFAVDDFDVFGKGSTLLRGHGRIDYSADGRTLITDGTSNTILISDARESKRELFLVDRLERAEPILAGKLSHAGRGKDFGYFPSVSNTPMFEGRVGRTLLSEKQKVHYTRERAVVAHSAESALPSLLYEHAAFTHDPRLFTDLVSYAPGLNTSRADLLAVLETEAAPNLRNSPGKIDPAALALIDRARQTGWQALTIPGGKDQPSLTLTFDGTGRYAYERTLPLGLRERVICDGATLWHLYPEIGLAARRTVSRFHQAELAELMPWTLPPATDLARGADLECVADNVVALVPQGAKTAKTTEGKPAPYLSLHLVFGDNGRLTERRVVEMPANKTHFREVYDGNGGVRLLDADDKELGKDKQTLRPARAPELKPDVEKLVVLPLPFRSRSHVMDALALDPSKPLSHDENGCFTYLEEDEALTLLGALLAERNEAEARLLVREFFQARGDRRSGYYTVLAACGADVNTELAFQRQLAESPNEPLLRYLALHGGDFYRMLRKIAPVSAPVALPDTFLGRLAEFQNELLRWQGDTNRWVAATVRHGDEKRSLDFIRRNRSNVLGWALLRRVTDRTLNGDVRNKKLADAWGLLAEASGGSYSCRYEQALRFYFGHGNGRAEAAALFRKLYDDALKEGVLPPIGYNFRDVIRGDVRNRDLFEALMLKTAAEFVAKKNRPAVVALALQCWQLGERPLSDNLLALALDGATDEVERAETILAAVRFLAQTDRLAGADDLVSKLLADEKIAAEPSLWRLASRLADRRGMPDRSLACLEKALDLEYQELPEVIDLEAWRRDYGTLLGHYHRLAAGARAVHAAPPEDLAARTVRAADRWRAHDPEVTRACQEAANILKLLGRKNLAWEYLTTPAATQPDRNVSFHGMALTLSREGDLDLAERAYASVAEREPDNGLILWERAENLRQAGRAGDADALLKRLADEKGTEAFERIRSQARWQLQRR
jgi:ferric-dicitrate binding protein FerR (iron transport regulator)